MKRHTLITHLQRHGCVLLREGSKHSIWTNPANGEVSQAPRHTEIIDVLARKICRELGIPSP